jgi:uncharacterized membrane protein
MEKNEVEFFGSRMSVGSHFHKMKSGVLNIFLLVQFQIFGKLFSKLKILYICLNDGKPLSKMSSCLKTGSDGASL